MPSDYKLVPIKPLSGIFDARSMPDEVGAGSFRLVKNYSVRSIGKRCRRGGWTKLLDGANSSYNNEDLHDQLIGLQAYYPGYTAFLTGGGDFDRYEYAYYYPDTAIDPYVLSFPIDQDYCGYSFSYYDTYPPVETPDSIFIYEDYIGYPYFVLTPPFNDCDYYVDGFFYQGSYFHLQRLQTVQGQFFPGHPYGPYIAIYDPTFGYTYEYCGENVQHRGGCREAITYLSEFRSPRNFRKLVAGTKSRLYALNERTGNWRILADGLGGSVDPELDCAACSQRRFLSAQMDSILILTNNFDPVLYWYFDDGPQGCDLWSAQPIQDLQDLNVTKVGCVAVHKGFAFYCDVEQDGTYYPNRVIWSDYKNAISVIPTADSLAGFQDIGSGERILRAEPLGDYLYLYTDQGIHRASLVSTDEVWNFEQIYRGPDALKYKFSLVNTGEKHYYLSSDKLMEMTLGYSDPIEVSWMRATSSVIFEGISEYNTAYGPLNNDLCDLVTGGYNATVKELLFSWASAGNVCPNVSLVFNLTKGQEAADLVDHGFTAFCWFESDRLPTVAEWLVELGACTWEQLAAQLVKEGTPLEPEVDPADPAPTCLYNETEDPDLPVSPNSLCAALGTRTPEDFCRGCTGPKIFIMASAVDYCLKSYADKTYYREMLQDTFYVLNGYGSVLQSGAENLKIDAEKNCKQLKAEYKAEPQTTPNLLYADVAYGTQASCLTWKNVRNVMPDGTIEAGVPLRCLTEFSEAQHQANQTRPAPDAGFYTAIRGKFLAYRLRIEGTGGGACFSQVSMEVARAEA